MNQINFSTLTPIQANTRSKNYDLRYRENNNRWEVNQRVFDHLGLDIKGFSILRSEDGTAVIAIVPNDQATVLRGTEGKKKGRFFTSSNFTDLVRAQHGQETTEFQMTYLGEQDNIHYYGVDSFKLSVVDSEMTVTIGAVGEFEDTEEELEVTNPLTD